MFAKVSDICAAIDKIAPANLAMSWDNVGLIVGDNDRVVRTVLLALDVTEDVVVEAIEKSCDLIVTHHPLMFKPVSKITTENSQGRKIIKLIENGISLVSAHTNLDIVAGGINDRLAEELGLVDVEILEILGASEKEDFGIGRYGFFKEEVQLDCIIKKLKEMLKLESVAVYGCSDKKISKVSICSGSGMSYVLAAIKNNSDIYITSDITYHDAQDAVEAGITLIDITHYAGENIILGFLSEKIKSILQDNGCETKILITETNGQIQKHF